MLCSIRLKVFSVKVLVSCHQLLTLRSHTINWCYLTMEWTVISQPIKKHADSKARYVPLTHMETLTPVNSKILRLYLNSIYLKPVSNAEGWVHLRWKNDKVKHNTMEEVRDLSRKRYSRANNRCQAWINTLLYGLRAELVSEHNCNDEQSKL